MKRQIWSQGKRELIKYFSKSAEGGNHEVFESNAGMYDPGFENGKLHGEVTWRGSNSSTGIYYLCDLRQVIYVFLAIKWEEYKRKNKMHEKYLEIQCLALSKHSVKAVGNGVAWLLVSFWGYFHSLWWLTKIGTNL